MSEIVGYMLTWTTYGTWLQGDERGWVKDSSVRKRNAVLCRINIENMKELKVGLKRLLADLIFGF